MADTRSFLLEWEAWISVRCQDTIMARDEAHARQQADFGAGMLTPGSIIEINRWRIRRKKLLRVVALPSSQEKRRCGNCAKWEPLFGVEVGASGFCLVREIHRFCWAADSCSIPSCWRPREEGK